MARATRACGGGGAATTLKRPKRRGDMPHRPPVLYAVLCYHLLLLSDEIFSCICNCGVIDFVTSTTLFSESCKCRNISTASCTHIPPHFLASQILRPPPYRYIDADVHHGDGVEEAFAYDRGVFSLSFHRHGPGFFPGTGDLPDVEAAVDDGDDDGAFLLFAFIVIDKMPHLIELTLFQRAVRSMFLTARASAMRRLRNCSSASSRLSLKRSGTHHSPATLLDVHLHRSALLRPQAIVLQLGADALFADR